MLVEPMCSVVQHGDSMDQVEIVNSMELLVRMMLGLNVGGNWWSTFVLESSIAW